MAKKQEKQAGVQVYGRTDDGLSNQSQFSSYSENKDVPDVNPPTGPQTIQERGEAQKGPVSYG